MGRLKDSVTEARAERLDEDPRFVALQDLVRELDSEGHDFSVDHGSVKYGLPEPPGKKTIRLDEVGHASFAIISDTHFGSRYEQTSALRDFISKVDAHNGGEGVSAILHAGDMTQGTPKMHRGMEHEVHLHSAEGQVGYTAEVLPKSRHGTPYYVISGNHDDSWLNESGTNVIRQVARLREDVHYIGQDSCYLTLGGDDEDPSVPALRTYLVHPAGGASYAKSYKPQKITESIPIANSVQFAGIGHYHTWGIFQHQDTIAAMLPCWQGQYPYLVRLALHPSIGGLIVDATFDKHKVQRLTYTYEDYREVEDDYDREASARWQRPGDPSLR